jgi:hypothetical protein
LHAVALFKQLMQEVMTQLLRMMSLLEELRLLAVREMLVLLFKQMM